MVEKISGMRLISRNSEIEYVQEKCFICQKAGGMLVGTDKGRSVSCVMPL